MTQPTETPTNRIPTWLTNGWLISVGLFLLALIPRLPDLGRFLTADEFLWVDRSRNFLAGLTNPAYQCTTVVEQWQYAEGLACTLRTGHPGVTTMWTGSFGFWLKWLWDGMPDTLHNYVVAVSTNPLDAAFIAPERLGTVLITSLWVVAIYWLVRRLLNPQIALVGALLLALDPFHIALSRVIHHDALSTTFMTLSALMALIYWGERENRWWLIGSGVLGGLGFLSKSPAMFLMPFITLTGLWFTIAHAETFSPRPFIHKLLYTLYDGLLWFLAAIVVVFAAWPAMWVIPTETLETVFFIGTKYATGGHAKGNYFLGTISNDPGVWFYPVTWLYRISPLVLIGLVGGAILWLRRKDEEFKQALRPFFKYLPLMLIFIAGYYLLMTIGEKKQDRYFLPVYPWTNLIAAAGLVSLLGYWFSRRLKRQMMPYLVGGILLINGLLVASHFPYYFTYYNPLLGGIRTAEQAVTLGWGEGIDLVAARLNELGDEQTRVASWYESTFAPFYEGESISYSKEKGKALAGDYVVFYINQTQREYPDLGFFEYYTSRFEPTEVITLKGVEYAWIYPSLGIDHYIQDQEYTGIAALLAWQWTEGDQPLTPGQPAEFDLYWEYLGKELDEPFFFRLVDAQGRIWAEGESRFLAEENPPREAWQLGEIIKERGSLTPPTHMPPGQYELHIGFYTDAPAVTTGELLFTVPPEERLITIDHTPSAVDLPQVQAIDAPLGDKLTLLGAAAPPEMTPLAPTYESYLTSAAAPHVPDDLTDLYPIDLYWRVEQPLNGDSALHLGLVDAQGEVVKGWFSLSLAELFHPTETTWQPGDIIHTRWHLGLQAEVPPGDYTFEVVDADNTEITLPFGAVTVLDGARVEGE